MTSDSHQLWVYARALGLTHQQLLDWYVDDHGEQAPHSKALAWARSLINRADDPELAQRQLRASVADSESRSWAPLVFRLEPAAHTALMARVSTDRGALPGDVPRSFLCPGHYLDAALCSGHGSPFEQMAKAAVLLPRGRGTTFSVGVSAHQVAKTLAAQFPGEAKHAVFSALTTRFLNRLGLHPSS
ncbi:hypothetical protein [Streptomyces griseus]|uniref:hypothetical protein n=1 Tax=Streptomyces griseus TaxID=1911 RepID=UPI00379C4FDC